ncbi:hypothetical protein B0H16DRAFT_1850644 [Mycena metata]|uniref:Uncharacterized protein n=1 Tax=Mycena metata TaxID=1033252 RepID=A0AAD7IRU8_9AGAR|nr:hypothetical protein B0H16DRAFT_1850644 [Mycena metata]
MRPTRSCRFLFLFRLPRPRFPWRSRSCRHSLRVPALHVTHRPASPRPPRLCSRRPITVHRARRRRPHRPHRPSASVLARVFHPFLDKAGWKSASYLGKLKPAAAGGDENGHNDNVPVFVFVQIIVQRDGMGKTVDCGIVQKDRMRGCEWNAAATRACAEPRGGIARTTSSSCDTYPRQTRSNACDDNGRTTGGSINILLHSCDKAVLGQFIEATRVHYTNAPISRATVLLTDNYGSWARADICCTGQEPGTGKSLTIHVLAGELGLEIIDDYTVGRLIRDTPSRCILLIEVILAGLLNVLDSVASEEGRLTFATTNHIEQLDPALIRPGRMDLKIQYGLATCEQLEQMFDCFYPFHEDYSAPASALAKEFAAAIPAGRYSIAPLQGYLLSSKNDPEGALEGIRAWMETQKKERRDMEELKQKRRKEAALRRAAEAAAESEVAEAVRRGNGGGENGYQNGRANGKTNGHVQKAVSEGEESDS